MDVAKYHKYIADGLLTCNSIYGFRGASPANISQFETDFPGAVVLPLSRNYRSRPDLVALAESFRCVQLELGQEPGKNQPVRLTHPGAYVTLAKAADEASELAGLVQDIRYKHASGYAYKDMVILCRTRSHAQKISRTLAAEGLPVIERGGMLEQDHIKDVLSIVLLLVDPSGMGLLRAARQHEHSLTPSDIEAFLLAAREQETSPRMLLLTGEIPLNISLAGHRALSRLSEILQALQRAPDLWSLLAQYLLVETSLVRDLLSAPESKQNNSILADYDSLLQLARHYDQQQQIHSRQREQEANGQGEQLSISPTLEERIKGFLEYLSLLVLLRQDGGNRQNPEDADGENADIIRVMTVHASKGLEFPIVYMPGLVQRRFPLQARSHPVSAPAGMLPPESVGSAAHESGESCLFYVGVTRARDHLLLSYSERYGKLKYKRSLYLDALEAGLPDDRITKLQWEPGTTEANSSSALSAQQENSLAPSTLQPGEAFINAMQSPTLNHSAIEAYQRCPRQYAYSNSYHFASEADGYLLFWQATQKTVEALREQVQRTNGDQPQPESIPTQQEIQARYTQHWQELGGHTTPFATLYEEHGHEVVEAERRKLTTQKDVASNLRPTFDVNIAGKTIQVTVDRVETATQTGASVKFIRTRYGKRKDKPAADMRDFFYMQAARQNHPGQNVELHSHNLSTGEAAPITMTSKKEQSLYNEVEQSIQGLERNEYPAQPAEPFHCPTCPFFLICPA
ncbi:MAG: ATP-dependent helicase [Chloroflexi bacterium]|nr:ATP-dependent helicase [Chloroflexota bacterium]